MPPIPYAPKKRNIRMKVELGVVDHTEATRYAAVTPCSLYMFSASKCKGVHTICNAIGDANWATMSAFYFFISHRETSALDTRGGTVNPPAIVSVSRARKIR